MRKFILFLLFAVVGCSSSDDNTPNIIPVVITPPDTALYHPPSELHGTWATGFYPFNRASFVFTSNSFAEYDVDNNLVNWDDLAQQYRDEGHNVTADEIRTSTSYEVIMWVDSQKLSREFHLDPTSHWMWGDYPIFKMSN